jgi:hypothetical protein
MCLCFFFSWEARIVGNECLIEGGKREGSRISNTCCDMYLAPWLDSRVTAIVSWTSQRKRVNVGIAYIKWKSGSIFRSEYPLEANESLCIDPRAMNSYTVIKIGNMCSHSYINHFQNSRRHLGWPQIRYRLMNNSHWADKRGGHYTSCWIKYDRVDAKYWIIRRHWRV